MISTKSSASSSTIHDKVEDRELEDGLGRRGLYTGSLHSRDQVPHGEGRMEYLEHDLIYEGHWVSGDWTGFGKLMEQQQHHHQHQHQHKSQPQDASVVYEGSFLDNHKHGLGVLTFTDGCVYDGTFHFDQLVGKGKMLFPDGTLYWGYYGLQNGKEQDQLRLLPHGRGKLTLMDGTVYDGEFEDGCIQGHGRMTLPDGRWYLGEWSDGQKNGLGLEVSSDGRLCHEGTFCNDLPVISSSFPKRTKSTQSQLLYRTSSSRNAVLVGPLPQHLPVPNMIHVGRLQ